ncbi:Hydrolase [Sulfitobacter noctilucae]|uniref:alpha/beta fold hydrolase n=1 Tax=Sulfitobacter noctilucae TaxID=1342302 RepID=UPI00046A1F5D|nr:alpha/beta hydrolase [Sulfitobacter noctilucae]KIN60945.1 Hydrolase [Sulfitobacter noctilucae]
MGRLLIFLALFVVGVVLLVQWQARAREQQAKETNPPTGTIITVDGTPVHYRIMGSGPDLVLLHGASGNIKDLTMNLTAQLTDRYRVILFDRPGLGWTGRLPGKSGPWNTASESPLEQAALLQKVADQIGVSSPIVMGHSFGGIVAIAWALNRPDETAALVLASAVAEPWPGELGWIYTVNGSPLGGALFVPMVSAFVPKSYIKQSIDATFAPQHAPAGYGEHIGVGMTLRRESLRANAQQVDQLRPHVVDMRQRYDALTMPIEAVHGDADTTVPLSVHAEVLMGDVPNGNLTVLPGQGHMLQHTAPAEVAAAIDRAAARAGLR